MAKKLTYKKTALLKAMKCVLKEYKTNKHSASIDICPLCKLYYQDDRFNDSRVSKGHECRSCPMHVFHKSNEKRFNIYSCMMRSCNPVECDNYTKDSDELNAVIKFYEEAIATVQDMTSEELNEPKAFMFLKKLDKRFAKEFHLV